MTRFPRESGERAHRVKEVREHECKHKHERRERPNSLKRAEGKLANQREVRFGEDLLRQCGHTETPAARVCDLAVGSTPGAELCDGLHDDGDRGFREQAVFKSEVQHCGGVFLGLVVDFGDDFLWFLVGRGLKVGACGWVVSVPVVGPWEEAGHRPGAGAVEPFTGERFTRYDLPRFPVRYDLPCSPRVVRTQVVSEPWWLYPFRVRHEGFPIVWSGWIVPLHRRFLPVSESRLGSRHIVSGCEDWALITV